MTDLNKNIPETRTDVDGQTRESDKTKDAAQNKIVDTFTDYFKIDQVLLNNKDATPKELFSAIKAHLQTHENINIKNQLQNMRDIMNQFTDKEQELFGEVCKKVIKGEYNNSHRTDANTDDTLYCIADVMFKCGKKMPDNFFNLAREIKEIPVCRNYFSINEEDLNNRYILGNMKRYFENEKHIEGAGFHFWGSTSFDEDTIQFICDELKDMDSCNLQFFNPEDLDDTCIELLKQFQQEQKSKGKRVYLYIPGKVDEK